MGFLKNNLMKLFFCYFRREKCTHYWKRNVYFCISLTVQNVLESWSLAM